VSWIQANMSVLLWATGVPTAGAGVLALFPEAVLRFLGLPPERTLVARHAGVLISVFGFGLVWAAGDPDRHRAVIAMTLAEKLGFVLLVALHARGASARLLAIAGFDLACVGLFGLYLAA